LEQLDIAVGHSAGSKTWKNQKWDWETLAEKLLTPHHTNENIKEFLAATKDEQGKMKDVGGYVGGYLRGGRRKPTNVLHRQLITLDVDAAHNNFWSDFQMQFDNAAVLHGTHKHTDASPRYRLVMPLSRECSPDEYVATARYIAGLLGIDLFDNTTFQTARLMFWPSSPKDVEYYAVSQDGPWIDVDQTLDSYVDWTDSSAWPTATVVDEEVRAASKKQEDPETKKGLIGAFCRAYTIPDVIEKFLSAEYVPADGDRYTYTKGSAAGGLVVYDDKFAYSHHGTDPTGGKLSNAFDLVRVHKFGHLDTAAVSGRPKSFLAMEDLVRNDDLVKDTLARERISESKYDFAEGLETEEEDDQWAKKLEIDKNGKCLATSGNISIILENDPRLKGAFQENQFDDKKYVVKSLPWRKITKPETIKNVDFSGVRNYLERMYGIAAISKVDDALNLEFDKKSFHPIKDYLNSLEWDGVERVDTLLIEYFGAHDNIYTREAIRKMLVGAIARIFRPGVKFDLVLTLVGARQGTGKSTFLAKLGKEWFSDSFHTVQGKEAFEQLQGAWLIEMAELSGIRKTEIEAIKHFITKQEDTFRPAYGRIPETFKRRCVFFATTNEKDFLRDPSGNRRFMPIDINEYAATKDVLFSRDLDDDVDQIWAEAMELYKAGEKLYLSPEAELIAKAEQSSHSQVDDRQGLVLQYLEKLLPENWEDLDLYERRSFLNDEIAPKGTQLRQTVSVVEVWCECLGKDKNELDRFKSREISDILRSFIDWEQQSHTKRYKLYGPQKYYTRRMY
jgi:putative DNA primase/helicase